MNDHCRACDSPYFADFFTEAGHMTYPVEGPEICDRCERELRLMADGIDVREVWGRFIPGAWSPMREPLVVVCQTFGAT